MRDLNRFFWVFLLRWLLLTLAWFIYFADVFKLALSCNREKLSGAFDFSNDFSAYFFSYYFAFFFR